LSGPAAGAAAGGPVRRGGLLRVLTGYPPDPGARGPSGWSAPGIPPVDYERVNLPTLIPPKQV